MSQSLIGDTLEVRRSCLRMNFVSTKQWEELQSIKAKKATMVSIIGAETESKKDSGFERVEALRKTSGTAWWRSTQPPSHAEI